MCGLTGFMQPGWNAERLTTTVTAMAQAIAHRGPDDRGAWCDAEAGIALGHRRLSIIDLSPAGHQPMASADGRYVLAFNGEIYNHAELRAELQALGAAPAWRGHSDTETLLAAFGQWGIEATLARTVGMFAIALWDVQERSLHLARDRFGEKPLYYGWMGGAFAFGSELKALRAHPEFNNPICREALAQYFRFMAVPAPRSIYEGIYKLEPGCLLTLAGQPPASAPDRSLRPGQKHGNLSVSRWWSLADVVQNGAKDPIHDEVEAIAALQKTLAQAVSLQSLADVPLGAFLSGGIDSSAIVAFMQSQSTRPVKTFTVGFEDAGFDESPHAKAVAQHLGTEHSELFVTSREAQAVVPQLPSMYDEPFADSSQIPTHLVCKAARAEVTVALSGDAGDELFGGYNRYFWGPKVWNKVGWLPFPARRLLGKGISAVPPGVWDVLSTRVNRLRPGSGGIARAGEKAHKLSRRLQDVRSMDELYVSLVSEWLHPESLVKPGLGELRYADCTLDDPIPATGLQSSQLRMMYRDSMGYLPDDILCKVDRAAMAISLETRVPFLDHRVAELAWRLPLAMKIRGNQGKWALRQLLYQHVPRELIERPKMGFGIPLGDWLRGPLRAWAEALLNEARIEREGYLYPARIRETWQQHVSGKFDWTAKLWSVLMFQAWLEENR